MENISFRTTVLPLSDRLFRLALRITMNRAEAEDVVQDTLMKVWEQRKEWEQIKNLEAFAIATCRNRALDIIKRAGRNTVSLEVVDKRQHTTDNGLQPLEAREQISLVRQILDELPEHQRTIIVLRDIERKTYQEIAEALDISETQVKVYLHRARTKVKERIKEPL
jgi:RNA polymerase sigma-70 factor (ECF subfamily)